MIPLSPCQVMLALSLMAFGTFWILRLSMLDSSDD